VASRFGVLAVLVSAVLLVPSFAAAEGTPAAGSDAKTLASVAPEFTAKGLDGQTYKLSELLQKGPVLLSFWTTYCKPCLQEMPELQKVWQRRKEAGLTYVGIACDNSKSVAQVKPKVQSMKFKFPIISDVDQKIMGLYNVRNCPTTVLIAPDGKIVLFRLGYTKGAEAEIEEKIVSLLPGGGGK
jgi:peroxiredoxin